GRLPVLEEHDLNVRPHLRRLAVLPDEEHETVRMGKGIVAEEDNGALRACVDLLDIGAPAIRLYRRDLEQISHLVRQHAEAAAQLGGEIVNLLIGVEIGEPAIK